MNPARRRVVFTGLAGAAALAAIRWLRPAERLLDNASGFALSSDAADILHALVPALLDGALPVNASERSAAVDETVAAMGTAIAGLPPGTREELGALFAALALPPVRIAFSGIDTPWTNASAAQANAFLGRLQRSRWPVKRAIYGALHQLAFAAWYANARTWPSLGYPGPPEMT